MKHLYLVIIIAFALTSCKNDGSKSSSNVTLNSKIDTISYLFGYNTGDAWRKQGFEEINYNIYKNGIDEAMSGNDSKIDNQEGAKIVRQYLSERNEEIGKVNLEKGKKFLEKNKKKKGVQTTESGLQYEVLKEGSGKTANKTDTVVLHYHGTTIDGDVFDSTVDKGQPIERGVNKFVSGFTEGLQLMNEGSKYKFYIPANLAYGKRGIGPIKPNSVIQFEVELLEIKEKQE